MSKALIVYGPIQTLVNGWGIVLAGGWGASGNLSWAAYQATEGATFSRLSFRISSGGSGTNNLRFQKNVTNATQIATVVGPGLAEDTTHSDVLVATDTFGGSYTDSGTDSSVIFARCNVEFASGHGNFHATSDLTNNPIFDVPGIRYVAFAGRLIFDGFASASAQQWRNRAYDLCPALQIRVYANARVNDSIVSLNVNGTNVGTTITVGAGLTGHFVVTGIDQALSSGDLICSSVTLGAGTEDLQLQIIGGTFKSSTIKSDIWAHNQVGRTRTASDTPNYVPPGGELSFLLAPTEENARLKLGFPCRIANLRSYVSANTYTGASTVKVFVNGSAALTLTIAAAATGWLENSIDGINVGANDEVSLEFLGGTSGSATFYSAGFTMEPVSITPVSVEFDHETSTASLTSDLVSLGAEFDHEAQNASLIQAHVVSPDSLEYGVESGAPALTYNIVAQESEFGNEIGSASLIVTFGIGSSEYESEIEFAALTQEHVLAIDGGEYDLEADSCALTQEHNLSTDSSELDYEIKSSPLTLQSGAGVDSSEYDFYAESVALDVTAPGKALLVWGPDVLIANNESIPLFGHRAGFAGFEDEQRYVATEAATFSNLAWNFLTGGSGTNNLRFTIDGVSGNQLATRAGPGFSEDSVNTDVLAENDAFSCFGTRTGTSPATNVWVSCNVTFDVGNGCFHASASGLQCSFGAASVTKYIALGGGLIGGASTVIADIQWKNRAYTSIEAIQINIPVNARTTSSTVRVNVNGTPVGTTLTIGAGLTGNFLVAGMGLSISDGDLVCLQFTTGTGSETAGPTLFGATLKSTSGASEVFTQAYAGVVRSASGTANYYPIGGNFESSGTEAQSRIKPGFACKITNPRIYASSNTYTGAATLKVFVNGAAALTTTIAASTTGWFENTADIFIIDEDDEVSFELLGGTSGSATFRGAGITFEPPGPPIVAQASEYDFDAQSTALISDISTFTPEFDHEIESAAINQSHALGSDSLEFDFEVESAALPLAIADDAGFQCEAFQANAFQNDCDRVDIFPFEFGWEAKSVGLTSHHLLSSDSLEYGWETVSVQNKIFRPAGTPTHRRRYVIE